MHFFRVFTSGLSRASLRRGSIVWFLTAAIAGPGSAQTRVQPVLGFPETGLDDPAAYQGYQTRFFRDTKGNVVQ
ncbi:MAG TPA: hypothetical protein VD758_00915, partial [Gemmatimonadaceae bacterium]|nr:hypothetical protein [Gemmatimonadaceae bacterium]